MPCRPAAAPPAVPEKEKKGASRWDGDVETTRKKVTVSKPGASQMPMTQRREEGALLSPSC